MWNAEGSTINFYFGERRFFQGEWRGHRRVTGLPAPWLSFLTSISNAHTGSAHIQEKNAHRVKLYAYVQTLFMGLHLNKESPPFKIRYPYGVDWTLRHHNRDAIIFFNGLREKSVTNHRGWATLVLSLSSTNTQREKIHRTIECKCRCYESAVQSFYKWLYRGLWHSKCKKEKEKGKWNHSFPCRWFLSWALSIQISPTHTFHLVLFLKWSITHFF